MTFELSAGQRWYVAHTLPQRETTALAHLERQNFKTFLPRRQKTVRHARTLRNVLAPVFPRYLFAAFDVEVDRWRSINGTTGVAGLLMGQERPIPVPDGVVETLLCAYDAEYGLQFAERMRPGDKVRLSAGPFADMLGVLERLDGAGRVEVLLQIMNVGVRTRLPRGWVEPAA